MRCGQCKGQLSSANLHLHKKCFERVLADREPCAACAQCQDARDYTGPADGLRDAVGVLLAHPHGKNGTGGA